MSADLISTLVPYLSRVELDVTGSVRTILQTADKYGLRKKEDQLSEKPSGEKSSDSQPASQQV